MPRALPVLSPPPDSHAAATLPGGTPRHVDQLPAPPQLLTLSTRLRKNQSLRGGARVAGLPRQGLAVKRNHQFTRLDLDPFRQFLRQRLAFAAVGVQTVSRLGIEPAP
ncbi:hypothetical protein NVIRENTERO_02070 [Sodalis praecaptivus]|nr:hypothetical protein NVIRENTERO_02070 [Sodalis praecaptivus]